MPTWLEENIVALVGHGLTLLGIVAAAWAVTWQLGRQHESSLRLQKENARQELMMGLHRTLIAQIRKVIEANVSARMYPVIALANLKVRNLNRNSGLPTFPLRERAQELSDLNTAAQNESVKLIQEFEAWAIAFPNIDIFQTAINVANYDAREAFNPMYVAFLRMLPMDPPENAPPNIPRPMEFGFPPEDQLAQLSEMVDRYTLAMDKLGCFVGDLTVESQNVLLSGLFDRTLQYRQPIDPQYRVITTEPTQVRELREYFEKQTAWGKAKQEAEAHARAQQQDSANDS